MKTCRKSRNLMLLAISAAIVVGGLGVTANAIPVLVTSRSALGGIDFIDWSVLGAPYTVVADPFNILSNSGIITATLSNPSGQFERRNQNTGWSGNFAPGDALLWTRNTVGPMVISFNNPVFGAGAQIQRDSFGTFTARIDVFDTLNNLKGTFNLAGNSTSNANNSAIFIGVLDTSPSIGRIEYSIDNVTQDFAVNQLDIVPEPGTALLVGLGGLALLRRRRK